LPPDGTDLVASDPESARGVMSNSIGEIAQELRPWWAGTDTVEPQEFGREVDEY
jgi:hypothetical protein